MSYYAHSENLNKEMHLLSKHLIEVANICESFTTNNIYKPIFRLAGLIHDLGKFNDEFQKYLLSQNKNFKISHSDIGAYYLKSKFKQNDASIAVLGHHGGLLNLEHWKLQIKKITNDHELLTKYSKISNIFENELQDELQKISSFDYTNFFKYFNNNKTEREMFIRYLFSALIDADWLSTEAHFEPEKSNLRNNKISINYDKFINTLNDYIKNKLNLNNNKICNLRNKAREEVINNAHNKTGFYSLILPTGLGKTLTSITWALLHAKFNNLERIIIVLPYINIIEQTAQILKNIFGTENVLEHHSNYYFENNENEIDYHYLASENWDFPLIITTTVQFFESLFSNKPSKCRKIHNIANSIVIFDEVQLLPTKLILPTLQILNDMHKVMNTSFLFCTATFPAFEERKNFKSGIKFYKLINNPQYYFNETSYRIEYKFINNLKIINYEQLCNLINDQNESALIVLNTKKTALKLFRTIQEQLNDKYNTIYYLSTALCYYHRLEILNEIKLKLNENKKILVVSTQLIEAGVDIDFPIVFRNLAPLDAIIQSSGRCNREGKLKLGKVFIFNLEDNNDNVMPDTLYSNAANLSSELITQNGVEKLKDYTIYKNYFEDLTKLYVNPDKYNICNERERLNFENICEKYKIINNPTIGLYIYNFNNESRKLYDEIKYKKYLNRNDWRLIQKFVVNVYKDFLQKYNNYYIIDKEKNIYIWYGKYDLKVGLMFEDEMENLII